MEEAILLTEGWPLILLQVGAGMCCTEDVAEEGQNGRERVEINLLTSSIKPLLGENDRRFTFEITTPLQGCAPSLLVMSHSSDCLQAQSEEALMGWIISLNTAISQVLDAQALPEKARGRSESADSKNSPAVIAANGAVPPAAASAAPAADSPLLLIRKVDPRNATCADCSAKGSISSAFFT